MKHRIAWISLAAAFALAPVAFAAPVAAKKAKPAAKDEQPAGRVVEYAELEHQLGAVVSVETNLGSVRRGVLIKYTNPALTLQLGPEAGSIQLSVPRESARRLSIVSEAPAATQEAGSAKKN